MSRDVPPGDNWPSVPDDWWGEYPAWPDERPVALRRRGIDAASLFFGLGTLVLVTVVVGYQIIAVVRGWVR